MSFHVFTYNENQKDGLHEVRPRQIFDYKIEADNFALNESTQSRRACFVMELVTSFEMRPIEIIRTEHRLTKIEYGEKL